MFWKPKSSGIIIVYVLHHILQCAGETVCRYLQALLSAIHCWCRRSSWGWRCLASRIDSCMAWGMFRDTQGRTAHRIKGRFISSRSWIFQTRSWWNKYQFETVRKIYVFFELLFKGIIKSILRLFFYHELIENLILINEIWVVFKAKDRRIVQWFDFFLCFFAYFVASQIEGLQCLPPNWFFILRYAIIAIPIASVVAEVSVVLLKKKTTNITICTSSHSLKKV